MVAATDQVQRQQGSLRASLLGSNSIFHQVQNLPASLHFKIVTIFSQLQILQFLVLPLRRLVKAIEALEFFFQD
jgi:hypothetical protein